MFHLNSLNTEDACWLHLLHISNARMCR